MKQLTLLKVLTFSALSLSLFPAFATDNVEQKVKDRRIVDKLIVAEEKQYTLSEIEEYKTRLLFEGPKKKEKDKHYLHFLVQHHMFFHSGFLIGRPFVPGPVLRELIRRAICSNPASVNKRLSKNGDIPLMFMAGYGDTGLYSVADDRVHKYDTQTRILKFQRTKAVARLFLKHGADPNATNEEGKTPKDIAEEQWKLGCASPEFKAIFDPKQQ